MKWKVHIREDRSGETIPVEVEAPTEVEAMVHAMLKHEYCSYLGIEIWRDGKFVPVVNERQHRDMLA